MKMNKQLKPQTHVNSINDAVAQSRDSHDDSLNLRGSDVLAAPSEGVTGAVLEVVVSENIHD
jgi:hypothetical protein